MTAAAAQECDIPAGTSLRMNHFLQNQLANRFF
jgi:hypothetical protein